MKVIIYSKYNEEFKEKLASYNFDYESDYENLKKKIKNYDGLIAFGLKDDLDLSNLKWIQSLGAGVDWVVNNKTLNKDTIITRVTTGLEQLLFEYTLTRILFYYQNLLTHYDNQNNNKWERNLSTSIVGKKVLVIGTGKIGSHIGKELNRLKMDVYGANSTGYLIDGFKECFTFDTINTNLKYDVVINVLPSTKETINIFNESFFKKVLMDVYINVGRGTALVEEDLIKALEKGIIKKAFLDVFQTEPLKDTSKLWHTKNLIITPHVAAFMDVDSLVKTIKDKYNKVLEDEVKDQVNIEKGY